MERIQLVAELVLLSLAAVTLLGHGAVEGKCNPGPAATLVEDGVNVEPRSFGTGLRCKYPFVKKLQNSTGCEVNAPNKWTLMQATGCCHPMCHQLLDNCDAKTKICYCGSNRKGSQLPGGNCTEGCPTGFVGNNCVKRCPCVHGYCDPYDLSCICHPGYKGKLCDEQCDRWMFGLECLKTCNGSCLGHIGCEPTGLTILEDRCICSIGEKVYWKSGDSKFQCQPCNGGTFGVGCSKKCNCQNGGTCDPVSGCVCNETLGFFGENCSTPCPFGMYGGGCLQNCSRQCQPGTPCDPINGTCERCADGFYGNGYNCRKCDCLHNTTTQYCNHTRGFCRCHHGYFGDNCAQCPTRYYGKDCANVCHHCQNGQSCDHVNGSCICIGFYGKFCGHPCQNSTFGRDCAHHCSDSCPFGTCNRVNGSCDCRNGTYRSDMSLICDKVCPNGTYLLHSLHNDCQPCNCSQQHSQGCNASSGQCLCKPGWTSLSGCRLQCDSNTFGQNCQQKCNCNEHQNCNAVNGHCSCPRGFKGRRCMETCDPFHYGIDCGKECACIKSNTKQCDKENGYCQCKPGWTGPNCDSSSSDSSPRTVTPATTFVDKEKSGSSSPSSVILAITIGGGAICFLLLIGTVVLCRRAHHYSGVPKETIKKRSYKPRAVSSTASSIPEMASNPRYQQHTLQRQRSQMSDHNPQYDQFPPGLSEDQELIKLDKYKDKQQMSILAPDHNPLYFTDASANKDQRLKANEDQQSTEAQHKYSHLQFEPPARPPKPKHLEAAFPKFDESTGKYSKLDPQCKYRPTEEDVPVTNSNPQHMEPDKTVISERQTPTESSGYGQAPVQPSDSIQDEHMCDNPQYDSLPNPKEVTYSEAYDALPDNAPRNSQRLSNGAVHGYSHVDVKSKSKRKHLQPSNSEQI